MRSMRLLRGGGSMLARLNPFGYKLTTLGDQFFEFEGSRDSDRSRLLSALKSRKTMSRLKSEWLEVQRNAKSGRASGYTGKLMRSLVALLLQISVMNKTSSSREAIIRERRAAL